MGETGSIQTQCCNHRVNGACSVIERNIWCSFTDPDGGHFQRCPICPNPGIGCTSIQMLVISSSTWSQSRWVARSPSCSSSPPSCPVSPLWGPPSAWPTSRSQVAVIIIIITVIIIIHNHVTNSQYHCLCHNCYYYHYSNHYLCHNHCHYRPSSPVPISHVTSLQGTTAVLPCDVASTSGWVGFVFEMFGFFFLF